MKEEQDNEKMVITERFLNALDYLVDSGRIKTFADLERESGIRQQKITAVRNFLKGDSKFGNYATISQIKTVHELYDVSLDYIFTGAKPIVIEQTKNVTPENINSNPANNELRQEMEFIKEKIKLMNEKIEFYKELVSRKLS